MIKNSTELCAHCENLPVSKTDCFAVAGACVVSAKCSNAQQMDAVRNVLGQASASTPGAPIRPATFPKSIF